MLRSYTAILAGTRTDLKQSVRGRCRGSMQILISNVLLLVIAGGIGYLIAQSRPQWFGPEFRQRLVFAGWIVALLLAGALRAAALVYGPEAMLGLFTLGGGFVLGVWLGLKPARSGR